MLLLPFPLHTQCMTKDNNYLSPDIGERAWYLLSGKPPEFVLRAAPFILAIILKLTCPICTLV